MKKTLILPLIVLMMAAVPHVLFAEEVDKDKTIPVQVAQQTGQIQRGAGSDDENIVLPTSLIPMPFDEALRNMQQMNRSLNDFNDDFQRGFREGWDRYSGGAHFKPAMDVMETPNEMIITCDMPGVEKKNIQVEISSGILSIHGLRNVTQEEVQNEKDLRFHRRERSYGSFTRSIRVPETVDASKVAAECKDGVLTVKLPKTRKDQPIQVKVE